MTRKPMFRYKEKWKRRHESSNRAAPGSPKSRFQARHGLTVSTLLATSTLRDNQLTGRE